MMAALWKRSEVSFKVSSRAFLHFQPQFYWIHILFFLQVDTIVFATGYNYDFSYLPNNVMYKSGHRVGLYKHVFPPNMEHPTLAVVGFIHALGAIMPQAEIQARWVTRVFKGKSVKLAYLLQLVWSLNQEQVIPLICSCLMFIAS